MNYQEMFYSPIIPRHIVTLTQRAAHNNVPVFIKGELGTGKELIAKIIHHTGDWKDYRFYKVDCRILTEDAFSAQLSRLLKESNDETTPATLYLKEVGYLGQENQLKLLELIEDGIFQSGIERRIFKNLRFISSSSEDLKEKGSGLGLSISNQIIQDHKGYIDVESQLNKGTSFFINLPISQDHPKRRQNDFESPPNIFNSIERQ